MIEIKIKKLLHFTTGKKDLSVDLQFARGSLNSIFGKSGAGKTTLLRILAGLTEPDSGLIKVGDSYWFNSNKKFNMPPQKRGIGYVFQDFALFPNMSVRQNLLYAVGSKRENKWVEEILEITGLTNLSSSNISSLSGGQQQRVALARALARKPQILLLDEPLTALDFDTRANLQDEILNIHNRYNITTILISHDKEEIIKMSDQVFHLEQGQIIESGKAGEIFSDLPYLNGVIQEVRQNENKLTVEIYFESNKSGIVKDENIFKPGQEVLITERKGSVDKK